jgi:ferredoxin
MEGLFLALCGNCNCGIRVEPLERSAAIERFELSLAFDPEISRLDCRYARVHTR